MKRRLSSVVFVLFLSVVACDGDKSGRTIWSDLVQRCAQNDLLGPDVLYFGPSNNIGPGSIWRKASNGAYFVRWLLPSIDSNTTTYVNPGTSTTCSGQSKSTVSVSPSVALETVAAPVSGSISADFKKARTTTVSIKGWQWDDIIEGPYEAKLKSQDLASSIKSDLGTGNRFAIERALKVVGMTADLEFSHDDAVNLKAKYNGPIGSVSAGNLGVGLNASWSGDTTLHLESTSTSGIYIAGTLRPVSLSGLSSASGPILGPKVSNLKNSKTAKDDTAQ